MSIIKYTLKFLLICAIFSNIATAFNCSNAYAEAFLSKRRKPPAEMYFDIALSVFPTYNSVIKNTPTNSSTNNQQNAKLALLPLIQAGMVRNYSDKLFIMLNAVVGPSYVYIGETQTQGGGFFTSADFSVGYDLWFKGKSFISFVAGLEFLYANSSSYPIHENSFSISANSQNNIRVGGDFFVGIIGFWHIKKIHSLKALLSFGAGPFAMAFTTGNGVGPSFNNTVIGIGIMPKLTITYAVKVQKDAAVRFSLASGARMFAMPANSGAPQQGILVSYPYVLASVGFGYKL